jgi:hypothetical protein
MSRLSREELEDFWALGVTLEAHRVPLDELAKAIRESRVKEAYSTSSMGTAETYWSDVSPGTDVAKLGRGTIVLLPGETSRDPTWSESVDDRDIDETLWSPLHDEQARRVCRRIPASRLRDFITEAARHLAGFEQRRRDGHTPRDAALIELARAVGEHGWLDAHDARLDALLDDAKGGVAALATRIRRVLRANDPHVALDVTVAAAPRDRQNDVRFELLRAGVRIARHAERNPTNAP